MGSNEGPQRTALDWTTRHFGFPGLQCLGGIHTISDHFVAVCSDASGSGRKEYGGITRPSGVGLAVYASSGCGVWVWLIPPRDIMDWGPCKGRKVVVAWVVCVVSLGDEVCDGYSVNYIRRGERCKSSGRRGAEGLDSCRRGCEIF